MQRSSLKLVPEKTEAVVFCGNRRPKAIRVMLNNTAVFPIKTVKYLGVTTDQVISIIEHKNRFTGNALNKNNEKYLQTTARVKTSPESVGAYKLVSREAVDNINKLDGRRKRHHVRKYREQKGEPEKDR